MKFKLPTRELIDLVTALLEAGEAPDNIPTIVGEFLDELLDFS
jgi:hypothetical protein